MIRIGDEVYVHGYVDEIRQDIIIIRNGGGFFGTAKQEVFKYDACKALSAYESLESEYKAYHTNSDYWRGVRYALDVIGGNKNDT